jgi:hypothetical protein
MFNVIFDVLDCMRSMKGFLMGHRRELLSLMNHRALSFKQKHLLFPELKVNQLKNLFGITQIDELRLISKPTTSVEA